MVDALYVNTMFKAIELVLLFWLLGLLFKWTIVFVFGEKGAKIVGFLGYMVNFAIKKFMLEKIFKIEVYESDPFRLKFDYEETDRWDILFTSLVIMPMGLGLTLGTIVGTIGFLVEENLVVLSIFLYVFGFLIAVNSIPTFQDVQELTKCSVKSIVVWFVIGSVLCTIFAVVLVPFLESLGILVAIMAGIICTSIITFFIPPISDRMTPAESKSLIGGIVDLDS